MPRKLKQILTDLRNDGTIEWILQPDGSVHPNDERALLNGCTFDVVAAQKIQDFCVQFLTLPFEPGERLAPYELESIARRYPNYDPDELSATTGRRNTRKPFAMFGWWHRRVFGQLYGWLNEDGSRRYRKAFVTTAKKSGKTSTLAALPIIDMLLDPMPEKEVYIVASTEDQATILFRKTQYTLQRSNQLQKFFKLKPSTQTIVHPSTGSFFKTLPAVASAVEGIQPSLLMLDELHAWPRRDLYDALVYGDIRKVNSLRVVITTAGNDENSVAYEEYEIAKQLLDPNDDYHQQDAFAFVAEAGRDPVTQQEVPWTWDSEEAIVQANPTLWENPAPLGKLRQELEAVKASPSKRRAWTRYILNRYVSTVEEAWITRDQWAQCGTDDMPDHLGEETWCGLDLARVEDLVAFASAWWAPDLDDVIDLRCTFWMPSEGVREKAERWRLPQLYNWIEEGWIKTTPGWAIETNFLRRAISGVTLDENGASRKERDADAYAELYDIRELAFDRNLATNLVLQQLSDYDGLPCIEHAQTYPGMSVPSKELYNRVLNCRLRHDNNPVLKWMFGHCIAPNDANDNIKPDKKKSRFKIDGCVASVMAVGRCALAKPPEKRVYNRRGVITI